MNKNELVLAEFKSPHDLLEAAKYITKKGYKNFDTYSPFPIHGMDDAMNLKHSILGWIVFFGGFFGLSVGFGMQTFMSLDYALIISGKPFFSYPAFIPVTFELMVLFSAFSTVFGMFALNKLPQHYHVIFKSDNFRKVTSDGFFLAIESCDPLYKQRNVVSELESINGMNIEVLKD